jgi:hypothetical protein
MKTTVCVACAAALLASCATPNTPGVGLGANYTPVIDLSGVDGNAYTRDLGDCRRLAATIGSSGGEVIGVSVLGAVVSAALASAAGLRGQWVERSANMGGIQTSAAVAADIQAKQRGVMINCMASRGYRTLDGATIVVQQASPVAPQASPVMQQQVLDSAPKLSALPASAAPNESPLPSAGPLPPPMAQASAPVRALTPVTTKAAVVAQGDFVYEAEKLGRTAGCNPLGQAVFGGKGPGWEAYTLRCENGNPMLVRCDFGNCREMK